ncbi:MAG: PH domain-containing protein [Halapricum sp.]
MDRIEPSLFVVIGFWYVYQGSLWSLRFLIPFGILYAGTVAIFEAIHWYRFAYRITENQDIEITSGIVRRRHRTVPREQIEQTSLVESPVGRLLGVIGIHLETAGNRDESEVELRYVSTDTATRLQDSLQVDVDAQIDGEPQALFELSNRQLLLSSTLQTHYATVLLAVGAVIATALLPAGGFQSLSDIIVLTFRSTIPVELGFSKWGVLIIFAVGIGWLIGVVRTAIRFYGFELRLQTDRLHRRHGLIHHVEKEIPIPNIRIIRLGDNPLFRVLGYVKLNAQTAGGEEIMPFNSNTVVIPLTERETAREVADCVGPSVSDADQRIPFRAWRRYTVRYLLLAAGVAGLGIGGTCYINISPVLVLQSSIFLSLLCPVCAYIRWSNISYAVGPDSLRIRKGFWNGQNYRIDFDDVQQCSVTTTLFQRRNELATVRIETAAYPLSIGATVPDMGHCAANDLSEKLRE